MGTATRRRLPPPEELPNVARARFGALTVQFNSPDLAEGLHIGHPWPLGASLTRRGVNFSVVAPLATRVELLLFTDGDAVEPERVVELGHRHRSADYWHVEVEGVGLGHCYGYRVFGPLQPGGGNPPP